MKRAATIPTLALTMVFAGVAQAQLANETELKLRAGGFGEGNRDLGQIDGAESSEFFTEIHGSLFTRYDNDLSSKLRVQGFYSTGEVFLNTEDTPQPSDRYIALREAWVDIGAMTSFPGEVLRIGRQRIRQDDGLWYDDDALGLKWVFDTTLLQADIAAVQQVEGFRTDDAGVDEAQKDRIYVLGGLSGQYVPSHFMGLRVAHAQDHFSLAREAQRPADERRKRKRDFTWGGLYLHNGYHNYKEARRFAYWFEIMAQIGKEKFFVQDAEVPEPRTRTIDDRDVRGLGGSVALRYRPSLDIPFQFGALYALGTGDNGDGDSSRFEQTGLQSNRARFTGTRTQIERFNGSAQFELSNLRAASAFISFPHRVLDVSLVAHRFKRDDGRDTVISNGLRAETVGSDTDIGTAYDFVVSGYFEGFSARLLRPDGPAGVVRLRFSMFEPGDAYPAGADSSYRAVLETGWRL